MKTNFTFEDVCQFVQSDYPELKEDIDALLSLIILLSPFFFSCPQATALATVGVLSDLLGVKDGIIKVGERIFTRITERDSEDPVNRQRRMQMAYILICYTAFFDTLDKTLPKVMKELKLKPFEKKRLSELAAERLKTREKEEEAEQKFPDIIYKELELPHPADSFHAQKHQLIPLYVELSSGFMKFLESFVLWEKAKNKQREEIKHSLENLPNQAYERFEAQYYSLATKYQEFYVWANLHEHKETHEKLRDMSVYIQKHVELANSQLGTIDVGMKRLTELVNLIPGAIGSHQANKALQELETYYANRIEEPVVVDTTESASNQLQLVFPKKSEIFIPQAFQVIRYSGKSLEDEETWKTASIRDDLGTFLLAYFSSPYSTNNPLVILGHPGSGKSLLTQLIAARLIPSPYTPIRVALRDIEADDEIAVQVEKQIKKDTKREVSWASLADAFNEKPALVILDGYDEVLQVSGKVYSGYVRKTQKFQENELYLGRQPVRTIVTSRITLIDKADIPQGTTIIRLKPFDNKKCENWATVWNRINKQYFEQRSIKPFIVPQARNLVELAEQPLLLLMLAIYDSESNQLQESQELDQTILYNRLLKRFIRREREKDEAFFELPEEDRAKEIEYEMERLGVAALGMFNRRKLHIKVSELNRDLSFFGLEKGIAKPGGPNLSQADLLLGSFFFVHESKSSNVSEETGDRSRDIAFEFLHNTFGEFLTAEFILRKVVKVCDTLYKLRSAGLEEERSNKLNRPDEFPTICLAFAPLFSRPIILSMMREWIKHKLIREKLDNDEFLYELNAIVNSEIQRLLSKNRLSAVLMGTLEDNPFPSYPMIGHMAIYSLNLILLRALLSSNGYTFNEEQIMPYVDGARAWDTLTFLWRSWFSIESLNGVTAVITSERDKNKIHLRMKNTFSTPPSNSRLDSILNISTALSDNMLAGLTGILIYDAYKLDYALLDDYEQRLATENIDLRLEFLIKKLQNLKLSPDFNAVENLLDEIRGVLHDLDFTDTSNQARLATLIENCVHTSDSFLGREFAIDIFDRFFAYEGRSEGLYSAGLIASAIKLGFELEHYAFLRWYFDKFVSNGEFLKHFYMRYLQAGREMRHPPTGLVLETLKLAREFGDRRFLEHFYREYLRKAAK
ncbi:MAG: ATP-binding protein [Anaerolineales bacterium]|nr:ATP-binding protein [Anaerolineales bacterium]